MKQNETILPSLGEFFRRKRILCKLTQEDIAKSLKINQAVLKDVERGFIQDISILTKIGKLLNVSRQTIVELTQNSKVVEERMIKLLKG